jgi:HKD family nuclease
MYIYNALRSWADLIYNPLTGRQGLKTDYADASIQVTQFNRAGLIFRDFMFSPVFIGPAKMTETALDYTSEGIYKLTAQFTADSYTESRIGQ